MDQQKEIFNSLVFGLFPSYLADILYPRRSANDIIYREAAYKILERQEKGTPSVEHDAVFLFYRVSKRSRVWKVMERDAVSIEIKTTKGDIWGSDVTKYLNATRLFFIAAPLKLLPEIIERYHEHSRMDSIGIIDSDSGQIVMMPRYQNYSKSRRDTLLSHCYTSAHRIPFLYDTEPYQMSRVQTGAVRKPKFEVQGGLLVNVEYLNLFKR